MDRNGYKNKFSIKWKINENSMRINLDLNDEWDLNLN